jgi:hypothetical protein
MRSGLRGAIPPGAGLSQAGVSTGGVMADDIRDRHSDLRTRTATYVDTILQAAKPGELPVEQPTSPNS